MATFIIFSSDVETVFLLLSSTLGKEWSVIWFDLKVFVEELVDTLVLGNQCVENTQAHLELSSVLCVILLYIIFEILFYITVLL